MKTIDDKVEDEPTNGDKCLLRLRGEVIDKDYNIVEKNFCIIYNRTAKTCKYQGEVKLVKVGGATIYKRLCTHPSCKDKITGKEYDARTYANLLAQRRSS